MSHWTVTNLQTPGGLSVLPLQRDQIAMVYPLIQILKPDISLERWLAYARSLVHVRETGTTGAKVAVNHAGHIFGMFTWRQEDDLNHGRRLSVENFIAMEVVGLPIIGAAMVAEMKRQAAKQRCATVRAALPSRAAADKLGAMSTATLYCDAGPVIEREQVVSLMVGKPAPSAT